VAGLCWFAERLAQPTDINSKVVAATDANPHCQPAPNRACASQAVGWRAMQP